MTDKELRKLSRYDLVELLLAATKENDEMKKQMAWMDAQLQDKNLKIQNAGSIAEASLQLNGIFQAAQNAADQYLLNLKNCDAVCQQKEAEAQKKAAAILQDAQANAQRLEAQAKENAEAYWQSVSVRLEKFYQEHNGLREMLQINGVPGSVSRKP